MILAFIIPALNEEAALPLVIHDIHRVTAARRWPSHVMVADNGSTDRTREVAREAGAQVVSASRRGYGSACLAGMADLPGDTETVVFVDGDHSDFMDDLPMLLAPIEAGEADMVLGARTPVEAGALTLPQRFGNRLACGLLRILYRRQFSDLGPFRAIRRTALDRLAMQDPAFGWTVEMQIKAVKAGLRIVEVPVRYRARIGQSKISGTVTGVLKAGRAILWTIFKYA